MNLLLLTHAYPRWEGDFAGHFLADLAQDLTRAGHQVTVLAPHAAGLTPRESVNGVQIRRFRYAPTPLERLAYRGDLAERGRHPLSWPLLLAFLVAFSGAATRVAHQEQVDLLHAHWWLPAGFAARLAGLLSPRPVVVTLHGTDLRLLDLFWLRPVGRWVLGGPVRVTVVSQYLRKRLARLMPEVAARTRVVAWGRPKGSPAGQPPAHKKRPRAGEPINLITVGRLVPQKRMHLLLEAVAKLAEKGLPLHLQIVGEGGERKRLEERIRRLGLTGKADFLGAVPPQVVRSLLEEADLAVFPALEEGFGMALQEALAVGCPVVASDSGAHPELVHDGRTGLLVPPDDLAALVQTLEKACTDSDLRHGLSRAALAEEWEGVTTEEYLAVYQEAVNAVGP